MNLSSVTSSGCLSCRLPIDREGKVPADKLLCNIMPFVHFHMVMPPCGISVCMLMCQRITLPKLLHMLSEAYDSRLQVLVVTVCAREKLTNQEPIM